MTMSDAPSRSAPVTGEARFRARRIEVRREAGRRRLQRLVGLAVLGVVVVVCLGVAQSPLLDVDHISIEGTGQTTAEEILAAASIERGDTMLTLDLGAAASAVESLPWIHTATVTRSFPGDIAISVTERVPAAIVATADGDLIVDGTARVLGSVASVPDLADLATIEYEGTLSPGAEEDAALSTGLEVAALSGEGLRSSIALIRVEPELEVVLDVGGVARFGDDSALPDKVEALATVVARVDLECLAAIDLRVPTHPVLTRAPSC